MRFGADFGARVDRLTLRLDAARRRVDGQGGQRRVGRGEEWVGFRPYRAGDELRELDWTLLARLDRPFVRVTRQEARERWVVVLDTSASMGLGRPGKLQVAAEIAAAFAIHGLRLGAEPVLRSTDPGDPPFALDRPAQLPLLLRWFEERRASGGHAPEFERLRGTARDAARVLVVGDLAGPPDTTLFDLARRRQVAVVQVLDALELDPPLGAVRWTDPESGEVLELEVDRRRAGQYASSLSRRLEGWRTACGRHGVRHRVHGTDEPFERALEGLVLGQGDRRPVHGGGAPAGE